jgi:hypothetical protein
MNGGVFGSPAKYSKEAVMRSIYLLVAGSILGSCNYASPPPAVAAMQAANQQRAFEIFVAGKVAQPPTMCLPSSRAGDMTVIDGQTLGFRVGAGASQAYLVRLSPGCERLTNAGYALISRRPGGTDMCQNDIQQVVMNSTGMPVGGCTIEQIIPYVRR